MLALSERVGAMIVRRCGSFSIILEAGTQEGRAGAAAERRPKKATTGQCRMPIACRAVRKNTEDVQEHESRRYNMLLLLGCAKRRREL